MKLLLTSGGVTSPSIHSALVRLLGKPIEECRALCIPTAQWGHPMCGPTSVRGFVAAEPDWRYLSRLGWASLGVIELTALPSIGAERWAPWVRNADVLLVDGGEATYLCHWMRESGLADLLPSLPDMVWVGVSAGSMVLTPRIGSYFVEWPSAPDDRTLGVVDFSIFPHLDAFPTNTLPAAERWAAEVGVPAYAIDEQTAIKVVDGTAEIVSEGNGSCSTPVLSQANPHHEKRKSAARASPRLVRVAIDSWWTISAWSSSRSSRSTCVYVSAVIESERWPTRGRSAPKSPSWWCQRLIRRWRR